MKSHSECARNLPTRRLPRGFSLVEVTLALGLATFCLVALLGLLPAGLRNTRASSGQTAATGLLSAVITDLRCTPSGVEKSPRFEIAIPPAGISTSTNFLTEQGQRVPQPQADYAVISELSKTTGAMSATRGRILVYWPASAAFTNAQGSVEAVTQWGGN